MISYPVDVENTKWSVLDSSTGTIVARNKDWPTVDGREIPGQDPRYVFLLEIREDKLTYNSRTHNLVTSEEIDVESNTITKSFSTEKRPIEEINVSVETEEKEALESISPRDARDKLVLLGLGVLFKQIDLESLSTKEQVIANKCIEVGTKLWNNDALAKKKIQDLANGDSVDPGEGWDK